MPKEFPKRILFTQGLRRRETALKEVFASELINLKQRRGYLYPVEDFPNAITGTTPTVVWPFPQLKHGEELDLLCDQTELFTLAGLAATTVPIFKARDTSASFTITAGGPWHHASFSASYFLTNGTDFIFDNPWNTSDKVLGISNIGTDGVGFTSLCNDKGTLILGGFEGDYFVDSGDLNWGEFFQVWRKSAAGQIYVDEDFSVGTNWFMYYRPTDVEQPFTLLAALLSFPSGANFTDLMPHLLQALEQGTIGLMRVPSGDVQQVLSLGDFLMVYTDRGVYGYPRTDRGYGTPLVFTEQGIPSRGCAGGDQQAHAFIDNLGFLYTIRGTALEVYDANEYINDLTLSDINIVWREREREFYISDGTKSFILTEHGLTETEAVITSFLEHTGGETAISEGDYVNTLGDFLIVTNPVDMDFSGIKVVNFVEVQGIGLTSLTLQTDYIYDQSNTYVTSPLVGGSPDGVLWSGIGGSKFKFRIGGRIATGGRIDSILVRYQYADSRSVHGFRGGEAPIPSAQEQ